ncbi:MAG: hypothetical protein D6723_08610 [Acidobacteria bacterium]|nr:MAG: hypothetical protein D6723_08610 [Acidobacteriota bacterium]
MKNRTTFSLVSTMLIILCGWPRGISRPERSGPPVLSRSDAPQAAESRFGIDYVFPLQSFYQKEKWPRRFSRTGAGWVNFAQVSWSAIEPNPPRGGRHRYNWAGLDRSVRLWQKYGFRITVSLRLGNGWFAGPIEYRPGGMEFRNSDRLPAEEYMDDYRAWIAALVERYDDDGQDDMPGLRAPVLHYQVGNEYANPVFWTGTLDDYRILLEETVSAARSASADVHIISNGIRWNDLFHNDPDAQLFEERFAAFLESLPSDVWREAWQRARAMTELTVALAYLYDILDAGGNGPYETASAGYMAWVQKELAKHGLTTTIWDMEARSEPRLTFNPLVHFHPELVIPDGQRILQAMKNPADPLHDEAVAWYRAEQSRVLVKVFVTRFAAGFEKVFMGMPNDWDKMLARFTVANPFIGLTDSDGDPWPAFYALALLVDKLDGFAQAEKIEADPGVELYRFLFADGRPPVWVAWLWEDEVRGMNDPLPAREVRLPIRGPVTMYTIPTSGDHYRTVPLDGSPSGLAVELTPEPVLFQER